MIRRSTDVGIPGGRKALVFLVLWSGSASLPSGAEGIPWGKTLFYPALEINYLHEDNVFVQNEADVFPGVISSRQQYYRADLKLEIPFSRSHTTIQWSPQWRDYSSEEVDLADNWNHEFDLESELNFSGGFQLNFREHYLQDSVRVAEIPENAGEIQFGNDSFEVNSARLGFENPFLPRHLVRGGAAVRKTEFDRQTGAISFETEGVDLDLGYEYGLTPSRNLYFDLLYGTTEQNRGFSTTGILSKDYQDRRLEVGVRGSRGSRLDYEIQGGYRNLRFEPSAGSVVTDPGSDFSGPVFRAALNYRLSPRSSFRGSAGRDAFPSFFENQNFYVSYLLRLGFQRDLPRGLFWNGRASYRFNQYEDPLDCLRDALNNCVTNSLAPASFGRDREDEILTLELGIGYQFRETLTAGIAVRQSARDSNVLLDEGSGPFPAFDYDDTQVGLQIKWGWF